MRATIVAFYFLLGAISAAAQTAPIQTTLCEIRRAPSRFHGKVVQFRATYESTFEFSSFSHAGCSVYPAFNREAVASNAELQRFINLIREKPDTELAKHCDGCWKYSVSATFVAKVEAAHPGNDKAKLPGFGHMGWAKAQAEVIDVSKIEVTERKYE